MNKFTTILSVVLVTALAVSFTGCDDEEGTDPLDIIGSYSGGAGDHVITEEIWSITYEGSEPLVHHITEFSNDEQWLVAQNDASNAWNPSAWSLFEWIWDGEDLYYCQSVLDAATQEEALSGSTADSGDLAAGCAGFPWTLLTPDA